MGRANLQLVKHDLGIFTWGNVSGFDVDTGLVAIKPSGVAYFAWGADSLDAVHHAVVIEQMAKMASLTLAVNPDIGPGPRNEQLFGRIIDSSAKGRTS